MSLQKSYAGREKLLYDSLIKIIQKAGITITPTLEDAEGQPLILAALTGLLNEGSSGGGGDQDRKVNLALVTTTNDISISAGGTPAVIHVASKNHDLGLTSFRKETKKLYQLIVNLGIFKGYYLTLEDLKNAISNPQLGFYASIEGKIYVYDLFIEEPDWIDSEITAPAVSLIANTNGYTKLDSQDNKMALEISSQGITTPVKANVINDVVTRKIENNTGYYNFFYKQTVTPEKPGIAGAGNYTIKIPDNAIIDLDLTPIDTLVGTAFFNRVVPFGQMGIFVNSSTTLTIEGALFTAGNNAGTTPIYWSGTKFQLNSAFQVTGKFEVPLIKPDSRKKKNN